MELFLLAVAIASLVSAQVSGDAPWVMMQRGQEAQQRSMDQTLALIGQARRDRYLAEQQRVANEARANAQNAYADQTNADAVSASVSNEVNRRVGSLILAHKCDDARDEALRAGRFDLVEAVGKYCAE